MVQVTATFCGYVAANDESLLCVVFLWLYWLWLYDISVVKVA